MKRTINLLFSVILIAVSLFYTSVSNGQPANVGAIAKMTGDTLQKASSDTAWNTGGFISLNFGQVSLSNWAPGGENSMSLNSGFNGFANYDRGRIRWDNALILSYALQNTGSNGTRKTDDQIDFTSKFGFRFKKHQKWYYSALLNFKSQFTHGYDYPDDSTVVSKFLSPAYVTSSIGITWRPGSAFELLVSPVTSKMTIVGDSRLSDLGSFGVDKGKHVRSEMGAYLNAKFRKDILPNVTLASRLELFDNYTDPDKPNRKNVDVNWETGFLMKVNKLITASLVFQVVCDDNVLKTTQYRQVLGVGFGYRFASRK